MGFQGWDCLPGFPSWQCPPFSREEYPRRSWWNTPGSKITTWPTLVACDWCNFKNQFSNVANKRICCFKGYCENVWRHNFYFFRLCKIFACPKFWNLQIQTGIIRWCKKKYMTTKVELGILRNVQFTPGNHFYLFIIRLHMIKTHSYKT